MSKTKFVQKSSAENLIIEIKSKVIKEELMQFYGSRLTMTINNPQFDAEFRRWSINRSDSTHSFDEFYSSIETLHKLNGLPFLISYVDPRDNDLLPINNDDNFLRALTTARPLLRLFIQKKGDSFEESVRYGTMRPKNLISSLLGQTPVKAKALAISNPQDFRQVRETLFTKQKPSDDS